MGGRVGGGLETPAQSQAAKQNCKYNPGAQALPMRTAQCAQLWWRRRPRSALMGTARRRPCLPSQGHGLAGGSLRSDHLPWRRGRSNLGEVRAASSQLQLRPCPPGHWGDQQRERRGEQRREKMELAALRRHNESPYAHGRDPRRGRGSSWEVAECPPLPCCIITVSLRLDLHPAARPLA